MRSDLDPDGSPEDVDDDWAEDFDDDLDDVHPLKEEPDCDWCYDGGCSSCRPTRLQHWLFRLRWFRLRWSLHAIRSRWRHRRNRKPMSDEPPF